MGQGNPCIQCGACCAFFRVSFFWEESAPDDPLGVPAELTEENDEMFQSMKGTNQHSPRCIALQGKIGRQVSCAIYAQRSSTCREFGLHETDHVISVSSIDLDRCNQARKAWNLPPLNRADLLSLPIALSIRAVPAPNHPFIKNHHPRLF